MYGFLSSASRNLSLIKCAPCLKFLAIVATCFTLGACTTVFGGDDAEARRGGFTEKDVFERAVRALEAKQANAAIEHLQLLEARFPFGAYAEQAQLELIYAYYLASSYEAATASADRFIRLHPDHPNVDYAFYMRGLIAFSQDTSFFGQFLPIDISKRDPGSAREAYAHFSELLLRYPESPYGADARQRLIFLRNLLARHEIAVANYYFERGAYMAATNRGRYVVENFQGSPAVADALAVLAQGYTLMGYHELADNSIAVLGQNFPEHPALDEGGHFRRRGILAGNKRTLLNRLSFGLLGRPEPLSYDTRELYNSEYYDNTKLVSSGTPPKASGTPPASSTSPAPNTPPASGTPPKAATLVN